MVLFETVYLGKATFPYFYYVMYKERVVNHYEMEPNSFYGTTLMICIYASMVYNTILFVWLPLARIKGVSMADALSYMMIQGQFYLSCALVFIFLIAIILFSENRALSVTTLWVEFSVLFIWETVYFFIN